MADDAIDRATRIHHGDPNQPIFMLYVPGCSYALDHPTTERGEKIEAMHLFDEGYEKLRETIFENQQKLGVIPQGLELTPWPADILTPWDKLTPAAQKLFIRQVNVFAAYVAYNDHEMRRVTFCGEMILGNGRPQLSFQTASHSTPASRNRFLREGHHAKA